MALFSTCSGSQYLGADGACHTASGAGTVTSAGLVGTSNQITVTGASPITTSGSWTLSIPSSPIFSGVTTATTKSPVNPFTSSGGTAAVNLALGNVQEHILTENTTVALSNITAGQQVTFIIVQNASAAKTLAWPSTIHGGMTVDTALSTENVQTCTASGNGTDLYCAPGLIGIPAGGIL